LNESLDHLITANDENYINDSQLADFQEMFNRCLKLLNGYILFLKNKKADS
jgi:hypothetical protein